MSKKDWLIVVGMIAWGLIICLTLLQYRFEIFAVSLVYIILYWIIKKEDPITTTFNSIDLLIEIINKRKSFLENFGKLFFAVIFLLSAVAIILILILFVIFSNLLWLDIKFYATKIINWLK
jgi:hypothetical protein